MNKKLAPKKILLVDDEETILRSIGIDLRQEKYTVDLASDGSVALDHLAKNHYDLVITDLAMPGVNGLDVLQATKKIEPTTSVIILTGYADLESAVTALRLGANDYLQKPCDYEELLLRVRRCFEGQDLLHELKVKNQSLAESEAMQTLLLESATEGIFGFNGDGKMIFINSSAEKMLGYQAHELMAENLHELIHHSRNDGSPYPQTECRMTKALRDRKPIHTKDELLWCKDGTSVPVDYKSSPIWKYDQVVGVVVIFSDISDQKAQEEKREQLNSYLQQVEKHQSLCCMAGGIAHNFNNILTAVLGNLDLALLTMPTDLPERSFIESSFAAAKRAAQLSTKMLQFVGQGKTEREDLDLSIIVQESADLLIPQINNNINLDLACGKELFFSGDSSLVTQTVINLLTNALESIGDNPGTIILQTGKKYFSKEELQLPHITEKLPAKEYVYLTITDTGKGMKKEVLNRAFEPFFSEKFTGRGMGLATVLGIMRIHSGTIILKSVAGKGTTAQAIFPAVTLATKTVNTVQKSHMAPNHKGTVLLADDTPEILVIGKEFLKWLGFNVITAVDGVEALELFKTNRKDIILALLDVSMPHMDGIKVCNAIRATSDIPIIMVTAYSIEELSRKFPVKKAIGFLQKPFVGKNLEDKINEILYN